MSAPAVVREVRPKTADADVAVAERSGDFRFRGLLSPAELGGAAAGRASSLLEAAGRCSNRHLHRTRHDVHHEPNRMAACASASRHRRAVAAGSANRTADRRDRHGRPCLGWPELDARLCAHERLPAGHPLDKAVFGFDGARGIHRPRHPNGADARASRTARSYSRAPDISSTSAGSVSACRVGWRPAKRS